MDVPSSVIQPSATFKKEVSGVMGAIVFFFIVYFLLFILSIGLVAGCFYAGVGVITSVSHLFGIIAGLGLIGVGIMVFIFLIKFLFSVSKYDRSGIIEITEQDQPALFGFIRKLALDTQTTFPRRIYLSADVNACVFYDSSFLSMFLPVKKNLQIGLGLVNAVNISEFKAVMAHEFGHFSQRSMKLGSFVYHVNKIIFNMLFDNKGYAETLQSWANVHGIFALFATITAKIAESIQWILRQMYGIINKSYLRLSREMEFHADAVAASVSGSKSLVTALRRAELANSGYMIALQKCDDLFRQKRVSNNIYMNHSSLLLQLASEHNLTLEKNLPVVTDEFLKNNNLSRVNYKDQWASHPTTEEREEHLEKLGVEAQVINDSAWVLFRNTEELQEQLTQKIYSSIEMPDGVVKIGAAEFEEKVKLDLNKFSLPEEYNGYFDNRQIELPANDEWYCSQLHSTKTFEELFTITQSSLPKKIQAGANDVELLKAIAEKKIQTKTFDFDGIKHNRDEAAAVQVQLEEELKNWHAELVRSDEEAILFFLNKAHAHGKRDELQKEYANYFDMRKKADDFLQMMNDMLVVLGPVFAGQRLQIEEIKSMIGNVKRDHEPVFKRKLQYWIEEDAFAAEPALIVRIKKFVESDYAYFGETSFFENELQEMHSLCNESWVTLSNFIFRKFKGILVKQLSYLN